MSQKYEKLKGLLKELFQLDQPDLDFGIYRILHAKSGEVTQFLDNDLLPQVKEAFSQYRTADKVELEKELAKLVASIEAADMNPASSPKVQALRAKLTDDAVDVTALENEVYDRLFSFFRRYYSDGDFLSKRVYKPGVYALPYEGEEVKIHWANSDQYYIKTSEYLRDYAFRLRPEDEQKPMRVHFRLVEAAEGEHGNVKAAEGKDRVFILAAPGESGRDFIAEENGELNIRFEYRSATLDDWPAGEGKGKPPVQKDLIAIATSRILVVADAALEPWIVELGKSHFLGNGDKADYPKLEVHLRRYTARNTFDYFIHKNLGGFLRQELDFYIKNEVMHLDDVESESAPRVEQYLSKIKVIRRIAGKIITFVAQLEDFQKQLWLKKKFVVETQYCITLGTIPEKLYPDIASNEAQRTEWVRLFAIDEIKGDLATPGYNVPMTVEFLKAHPSLVVDTRHFTNNFTERLLGAIDGLATQLDGVLVHSENRQALSLLQARHRETVRCIYIDPPYNTSASEIAYKNSYKHSSWLSLIQDRIALGRTLLTPDGVLAVAIDDAELARLHVALIDMFGEENHLATAVVRAKPQGRAMAVGFSQNHEYAVFFANGPESSVGRLPRNEDRQARYAERDDDGIYAWANFRGTGANSYRRDRPKLYYPVWICTENGEITVPDLEWKEAEGSWASTGVRSANQVAVFPIDDDGVERVWTLGWERGQKEAGAQLIGRRTNGRWQVYRKYRPNQEGALPGTWWGDPKYSASESGTKVLQDIIGDTGAFSYPKSIFTVEDCIRSAGTGASDWVLDFFGGSGTTAHAVMNLNREDGGRRKFTVVEMGDYFDTVLLPRIKKVTFTPDWKNGKPKRMATPEEAERSPRIIKVIRLESYEDTLNNLEVSRKPTQQAVLNFAAAQGADGLKEQYLLSYMLNVETRDSQSLLNIDAFNDPTAYKLKVKRPGSDESREVNVDLLETFNWLIGLSVQHVAVSQSFAAEFEPDTEGRLHLKGQLHQDPTGPWWFRTVTGATPDGRRTLIIWRKLTSNLERDNVVLDDWFTKQGYSTKDSEFDLIYVNGGNNLGNLQGEGDNWKVRLLEEDFHRLMFETEGV